MGTTPNICKVIFIQIDLIQSLPLLRGQSVLISFCRRINIAIVSYVEILRLGIMAQPLCCQATDTHT